MTEEEGREREIDSKLKERKEHERHKCLVNPTGRKELVNRKVCKNKWYKHKNMEMAQCCRV